MLRDDVVHLGLGKFRIITFIMPVTTVAYHIDEDIIIETLPVFRGQFNSPDDGIRIVAIYVQHRCLYDACRRRGIRRRTCIIKIRGKSDLIVDDKMNGPPGIITRQLAHLNRLKNHSLSGCCSIPVDENRQDLVVIGSVEDIRFSPGKSFDHWIYSFQVGWIWCQFQVDIVIARRTYLGGIAHMVFHIPVPKTEIRHCSSLKLIKNLLIGFAHDVSKHIQAAPVGHTYDNLLNSKFSSFIDHGIQSGYGRFAPFQGEAFLTDVFGMQELLKDHCSV